MQDMSRQNKAVLGAPIAAGLGEILRKQVVHDVHVRACGGIEVLSLFPPIKKRKTEFFPVFLPICFGQGRRIGSHAGAVGIIDPESVKQRAAVRLIRKYAFDDASEEIPAVLCVFLVRAFQKQFGDFAVHRVYVGKTVIKFLARLFLFGKYGVFVPLFYLGGCRYGITVAQPLFSLIILFEQNGVTRENTRRFGTGKRFRVRIVKGNEPQAVFPLPRDFASAGTARPAVLVVKPGLHSKFFRFKRARADAFKPFRAEIFRPESRAGMHEKTSETHLVQDFHLS